MSKRPSPFTRCASSSVRTSEEFVSVNVTPKRTELSSQQKDHFT